MESQLCTQKNLNWAH